MEFLRTGVLDLIKPKGYQPVHYSSAQIGVISIPKPVSATSNQLVFCVWTQLMEIRSYFGYEQGT